MITAVIDLGTNTFHLLIAERNQYGFRELFRLRKYVKLGEHSPDFIGPQAFERGLNTVKEFSSICQNYGVTEVFALGTAMLRNAINTPSFIAAVRESTGINISVINGHEEARLIFRGVQNSLDLTAKKNLLMDIGGGSVEFIFSSSGAADWLESLDIGVSLLKHRFPVGDRFHSEDINKLENYLEFKLGPIHQKINGLSDLRIIGISGTFDVIQEHFSQLEKDVYPSDLVITPEKAIAFCDQIIPLSLEEKLNHPSVPDSRADLISYALIMVKKVIQQSGCTELKVSQHSIKEGKLADLV